MSLAQSFLDPEELYSLNGGEVGDCRQISKNESKLIEASLRKQLTRQLKLLKSLDDNIRFSTLHNRI